MGRAPLYELRLPGWVDEEVGDRERSYGLEERMDLAIRLSSRNVREGTGGPFGAAIFERDSGRLVAPGVNLVVTSNCSVAHAEIVAIIVAQQTAACWDLGAEHLARHELVASTEPCAMCFGALHWSGASSLVCGARDEDAREIGFDEGPKRDDWVAALEGRGVHVQRDVLRERARAVLLAYRDGGGEVYNAGVGS